MIQWKAQRLHDTGLNCSFRNWFIVIVVKLCGQKKDSRTQRFINYYLKVLLTYALVGTTVTILNTYILVLFVPGLSNIGFTLFLIPRLLEEIFMTVVISYITAFLLTVYDRVIYKKHVIEEV